MDIDRFPSVTQVRQSPPGELAVWLSTMSADAVSGLGVDAAEAVVMATQRVSSWAAAMQAVAVDRFAEHVLDAQEHHAADLMSARDAQREEVEAAGGVWRGDRGAIALPEPEQVAASMLAPELRISPRTMRTRLNRARWLTELPTTLGLALAGDLEPWRVDAVVAAAADVTPSTWWSSRRGCSPATWRPCRSRVWSSGRGLRRRGLTPSRLPAVKPGRRGVGPCGWVRRRCRG